MNLLLLLAFLLVPQQTAPTGTRIECTFESERTFTCNYPNGEREEFQITLPNAKHAWMKHLSDLQPGVSTLVIEEFSDRLCLMQVHIQGDLVRNPVNERINECVSTKRPRRKKHAL